MIAPLKRDVKAMLEVIRAEYDSEEDFAKALLVKAFEVYDEKQKWTVMGQLLHTHDDGVTKLPSSDPRAVKVAIGTYATEKQAQTAGESLWHNKSSGEVFRFWTVPMFMGTPAAYHAERKALRNTDQDDLVNAKVARIAATEQARLDALRAAEDELLPDYLR